jgi:hypothetical protein
MRAVPDYRKAHHFTSMLLGQIVPLVDSGSVEELDVPD